MDIEEVVCDLVDHWHDHGGAPDGSRVELYCWLGLDEGEADDFARYGDIPDRLHADLRAKHGRYCG